MVHSNPMQRRRRLSARTPAAGFALLLLPIARPCSSFVPPTAETAAAARALRRRTPFFFGAAIGRRDAAPPSTEELVRPRRRPPRAVPRARSISTAAAASGSAAIPGLLDPDTFSRRSRMDSAVRSLRSRLPSTLTEAMTPSSASEAYGPNCTLIGPSGETLADGRDELVTLSTAVVSACNAARGAGRLAETLRSSLQQQPLQPSLQQRQPSGDGSEGVEDSDGSVLCDIVADASDPSNLRVRWSARLPGGSVGDFRPPEIEGLSDFRLGSDGLVESHALRNVTVDGREVNAGVGEALAAMRRALKSARSAARSTARDSPFLQVFAEAAAPILTEIGEGILRGGGAEGEPEAKAAEEDRLAPLYLADPFPRTTDLEPWDGLNLTSADGPSDVVDGSDDDPSRIPLPGTAGWARYASSHAAISRFVESTIPLLAGEEDDDDPDALRSAFDPDATLRTVADGSSAALLSGGGRLADLYRAASSLRRSSGGDFRLTDAPRADWRERTVTVRWLSAFPVRVEGTDRFGLAESGEIRRVEQLELTVGGRSVAGSDAAAALLRAAEAGAGGEVATRLLRRIAGGGGGGRREPGSALAAGGGPTRRPEDRGPPELSAEAAASVYNLMRALHVELPRCLDGADPAAAPPPPSPSALLLPAAAFLSPDVELRGLLGEALARGIGPYRRAVGAALSSLHAAVRTGRVRVAAGGGGPTPKVELTSEGNVRVALTVELRVDAPSLPGAPGAPAPPGGPNGGGAGGGAEGGFPVKLELVSELRLNRDGRVIEHRILENRVNGRRSPADVVSGWIGGVGAASSQDDAAQGAVKAFLDAVSWARSVGAR